MSGGRRVVKPFDPETERNPRFPSSAELSTGVHEESSVARWW